MFDAILSLAIPPEIAPGYAAFLIGLSFLTSALTGALGLGGGVLMLAVLAQILPPALVIPIHGVVQVGSNAGRAAIMRRQIARHLIWPFLVGSAIGVAIGAPVATALPKPILELILGLFILWSAWAETLKPARLPPRWFLLVGGLSSFATMFIGGTGPLVAAFLVPDPLSRQQVIATHAAMMTLQHGLKIGAFTVLGFAFVPWLPLLILMVGLGFLGTLVGRRFLDRLPERIFTRAFRLVLSVLALNLAASGLIAVFKG